MCSSGNCDIGGIMGGPVGSLVGVGIKALINGAPIGPRSSEALNKPTEKERIKEFYDNVEAHLKGALQVLQPALEIKQILSGASKSAERDKSGITPQAVIQYYSPQNLRKSQTSHCQNRCSASQKSTACCSKKDKSTEKSTSQTKPSSSNCKNSIKIKKNETKKCSTRLDYETSSKSSGKSAKDEKSCKISTRVSKTNKRTETCCICDVSLKDNIVLAELPCEHLFCYTCLAIGNGKHCRKCDYTYDMKNVTQIYHKRSIRQ